MRVHHEEMVARAREMVIALARARVLPGLRQGGGVERKDAARREAEARVGVHERLVEGLDRPGAEELAGL